MAKNKETGQVDGPAEGAPKRGAASKQPRSAAADTGAAGGGAAAKGAAKSRSTSAAKGGARAGAAAGGRAKSQQPDLRQDLRDFASARPQGWGHDDWTNFLEHLQSRGHNVNDRDQIGSMLERERLALALERVPGMGPQRVQAIADKYGYLWRLREASPDEVAREANIPRPLAEKVVQAVRS